MDDLLERLRESSFDWDLEIAVSRCRDAADRIESQLKLIDVSGKINNQLMELVLEQKNHIDELEAALREIEMLHYDSETDFHHDAMKAHDIARAALGEKKDG